MRNSLGMTLPKTWLKAPRPEFRNSTMVRSFQCFQSTREFSSSILKIVTLRLAMAKVVLRWIRRNQPWMRHPWAEMREWSDSCAAITNGQSASLTSRSPRPFMSSSSSRSERHHRTALWHRPLLRDRTTTHLAALTTFATALFRLTMFRRSMSDRQSRGSCHSISRSMSSLRKSKRR